MTPEQSRLCADVIARQASRAIDDLGRRMREHGLEKRWEDEYVTVKTDAGLLLDLLGRLHQPSAVSVLKGAVESSQPWVKLWGALGLMRRGQAVPPEGHTRR